jgi:RNA ligase
MLDLGTLPEDLDSLNPVFISDGPAEVESVFVNDVLQPFGKQNPKLIGPSPIHPAATVDFDVLFTELEWNVSEGLVKVQTDGRFVQYTYTQKCVVDRAWNDYNVLARGIILDPPNKKIVALTFPKFFNYGERDNSLPNLPFQTYEKVDGSLIILFHDGYSWRTATKGSFDSEQAWNAADYLQTFDCTHLDPDVTYLCEWVGPTNRIVVQYENHDLVVLGAYNVVSGFEVPFELLSITAEAMGMRTAKVYSFNSISELIAKTKELPAMEEGFVVRFKNGYRLKFKGDEYKRVHALISRCTPLGIWNLLRAGDDLGEVRARLPEEFWPDFDGICQALLDQATSNLGRVFVAAHCYRNLSDKELGLRLNELDEVERKFIYHYRNQGVKFPEGRTRERFIDLIRPTGNKLEGYNPSWSMNRVSEEIF